MATADTFDPGGGGNTRQTILIVLGAVLLAALGWFLWVQLTQPITRKVEEDKAIFAVVQPDLPPPPPPPPPPDVKPPEPTEQQVTPAPVPQAAAPDAPAQTQMDAAPSAGVGGISAGSGTGMGAPGSAGTCLTPPCGSAKTTAAPFNEAFYRRSLSSELQSYIDRDKRLKRLEFTAGLHISISPSGAVTSVSLVKPSGKAEVDQQLTALLRGIRGLSAPPAGVRFPQNVNVKGRRPFA